MSGPQVLVTGGAGFIGSHLVDRLLELGYRVRILDVLTDQVHQSRVPPYLNPEAELLRGDICDPAAVRAALEGAEIVVHFAAAVGVGQSMYEIEQYCRTNVLGTATLLQAIVRGTRRPQRLLVASSMSIYGEGLYACGQCGPMNPYPRPRAQLAMHEWSVRCPRCDRPLEPRPTPEAKPLVPTSVYAINKRDQEEMVLAVARSAGIGAVALRFFNVYGTRQSLSNPYTGVAAIFASALLNRKPPMVFEDGLQARDFIHVSDIVEACVLAIRRQDISDEVFNVGTGVPTTLLELLAFLGAQIPQAGSVQPEILGQFREGDIRACYADVGAARQRLGFSPRVPIAQGLSEYAAWLASQMAETRSKEALAELQRHRLVL